MVRVACTPHKCKSWLLTPAVACCGYHVVSVGLLDLAPYIFGLISRLRAASQDLVKIVIEFMRLYTERATSGSCVGPCIAASWFFPRLH